MIYDHTRSIRRANNITLHVAYKNCGTGHRFANYTLILCIHALISKYSIIREY